MSEAVLVTGGARFIGSRLVERLLARGDQVVVVDSILNHPSMEEVVAKSDRVVHLAAAVGVRKILEKPVETITTNVRAPRSFWAAATFTRNPFTSLLHPRSMARPSNGCMRTTTESWEAHPIKGRTGSDSPKQVIPYEKAYGTGFEDMDRRQTDTTRIRNLLGWAPPRTQDGIIDEAARHMREGMGRE